MSVCLLDCFLEACISTVRMRLMRLGRLLSFMSSSRTRVVPPPAFLASAIKSLPAAGEGVAALQAVRAQLNDGDNVDTNEQLAAAAAAAATALEQAAHRHGKRGWTTLRDAARPAAASPAAACGLGAALALWRDRRLNTTAPHGDAAPARAAAAALFASVDAPLVGAGPVIDALLSQRPDLKIIAGFARSARAAPDAAKAAAAVRREVLNTDPPPPRDAIAGALALAAEVGAWDAACPPAALVAVAADAGLWAAAEGLVKAARDRGDAGAVPAAQTLVDACLARDLHRQADTHASQFADLCGAPRLVEARLRHAQDTLRKVVKKQQFGLVEKIVAGVDRAARRNQGDTARNHNTAARRNQDPANEARRTVRVLALELLAGASERALARDLRNTWSARDGVDVDLGFADTDDIAVLDAAARRERFLQWDEVLPAVPDLVDDAARLDAAAGALGDGPRAFDVEWSENAGAALLQLATLSSAVIVDVPKLCSTSDGCAALRRAFRGAPLLGFGCSQDLAKLRATPAVAPWVDDDQEIYDLQTALSRKRGGPGLAAAAKAYLGKALDKSQQCSDWDARPLSEAQRAYAALDAVTVVLIHEKLQSVDEAIEKLRRVPP